MKAAQYTTYGDYNVLEVNTDIPEPIPQNEQVSVDIHAAGINPIDYKIRNGMIQGVPSSFPATIGGDFAGVITDPGTSTFKTGDKVFGQAGIINGGSGSVAEKAVAPISKISTMPDISFEEAASLPLAAGSALQAIEEIIKLQPGQKILIQGGAGGIGSFAIQIAKARGGYVATTVSSDDTEFVKTLGADEVIDYKAQKINDVLEKYDAVFDTAGSQTWNDSISILKKGGIIVSMNGQPLPEFAKERGVTSIGQATDINPEKLMKLKQFVEEGKIKPQIDRVFPLEKTRDAFSYLEAGKSRGKIVIKIR